MDLIIFYPVNAQRFDLYLLRPCLDCLLTTASHTGTRTRTGPAEFRTGQSSGEVRVRLVRLIELSAGV